MFQSIMYFIFKEVYEVIQNIWSNSNINGERNAIAFTWKKSIEI